MVYVVVKTTVSMWCHIQMRNIHFQVNGVMSLHSLQVHLTFLNWFIFITIYVNEVTSSPSVNVILLSSTLTSSNGINDVSTLNTGNLSQCHNSCIQN